MELFPKFLIFRYLLVRPTYISSHKSKNSDDDFYHFDLFEISNLKTCRMLLAYLKLEMVPYKNGVDDLFMF